MRALFFLLDDNNNIVPTDDMYAVSELLQDEERCSVGHTDICGTTVSTVFLGINHQSTPGQTPLLFETAVISIGGIDIVERYHNWEAAETGHDKWVAQGKGEQLRVLGIKADIVQNAGLN